MNDSISNLILSHFLFPVLVALQALNATANSNIEVGRVFYNPCLLHFTTHK